MHQLDNGKQICSLASTENFLIVGTVNEILGWEWKAALQTKLSKPAWSIKISSQSKVEQTDVNSLWYSDENNKIYAGCGDNKIYVYNLEDGRLVNTFDGHKDYIHSVHGR